MNWYDLFNTLEAVLWVGVAVVVVRTPRRNRREAAACGLAVVGFLVFAATDLLEIGRDGRLPLWLWGLKIACGTAILAARFLWLGRFRWRSRELLFAVGCLLAVLLILVLQHLLDQRLTRFSA
jgi:uncharacterized membrane protein